MGNKLLCRRDINHTTVIDRMMTECGVRANVSFGHLDILECGIQQYTTIVVEIYHLPYYGRPVQLEYSSTSRHEVRVLSIFQTQLKYTRGIFG